MTETMLVTGANRGIGFAVCRGLLDKGYALVVTARDLGVAERAARKLEGRRGANVLPAVLDVASDESTAQLVKRVVEAGIRLDGLVNNAGISLDGFDADVAFATLQTNTFGPMRVSDVLASVLKNGARVVNVSSGMGHLSGFGEKLRNRFLGLKSRTELAALLGEFVTLVGEGGHREHGWPSNAYSVSKAGLNAFTRLLALEKPDAKVNAVCPGWVRTDMGGSWAPRSVEQGARGIVWAATLAKDGPTGGFFRDGAPIAW